VQVGTVRGHLLAQRDLSCMWCAARESVEGCVSKASGVTLSTLGPRVWSVGSVVYFRAGAGLSGDHNWACCNAMLSALGV